MATANWMPSALSKAFGGINWSSDTIKMALVKSTLGTVPPNIAQVFWSDISASETTNSSGTGYTAGGAALGTKTNTVTAANSWGTAWAASTAYAVGAVIRPGTGNGHLYVATAAGTSGGSTPTFPTTARNTVADNTVTWEEFGQSITVLSSAAVSWTSFTTTDYRYAVIYKDTGTGSTSPLLGVVDYGSAQTNGGGTLTITPDANLGLLYSIAY